MVKSLHAPSHNDGKEYKGKPQTQCHCWFLGWRSLWRCVRFRILQHDPASLRRVHDHFSFIDRTCPRHSFRWLAITPVIYSELRLTLAKIQTKRLNADHSRADSISGIRHRRFAASNHWFASWSYRHLPPANLAGAWRRLHCQLMDIHDLKNHPV